MGGKKNKNKKKKVSAKREKYAKFRKAKPDSVNMSLPDMTSDEMKKQRDDQDKMERFFRYNRNPQAKEVSERRMKSKR